MKKLTKKQFVNEALKGPVEIDDNLYYIIAKVNDTDLEMTPKLKGQLEDEGLYDNSYIGVITPNKDKPCPMSYLPVYGRTDKYETKHFQSDNEKTIMKDLGSRQLDILNRHFNHISK